ncbi:MAG: type II toxin-antitoxin system VapC family toxin, partial [Actinomycetota bacterium]
LWDGCDAPVSSRLAYPEVRSALAAAGHAGRLDEAGRQDAEQVWEDFWSATRAVELTDAVARHAGWLATELTLRGADAVHLASLLALGVEDVVLAVWDVKLRSGAEAAGVRVVPTAR